MSLTERACDALTAEPAGRRRLAFLSFLESTVVPIPLETVVGPLMAAHPKRAYTMALAIFLGCLAGAVIFYFVAMALYDPVVAPVLSFLGLESSFEDMRHRLDEDDFFWAVFLVSLTPAPFQLATLGAGAVGGSLPLFVGAVGLSRALRYFGLAFLAKHFGPRLTELAGGRGPLVLKGALLLVGIYLVLSLVLSGS